MRRVLLESGSGGVLMAHDYSKTHGTAQSPVGGEIDTETQTFSTVTLEAEHVTERHDPDPHAKDVPTINLPGMVNLYVVIDGGRVLLDSIPAARVFKAQAAAKKSKSSKS